jgi:hypothetical protein
VRPEQPHYAVADKRRLFELFTNIKAKRDSSQGFPLVSLLRKGRCVESVSCWSRPLPLSPSLSSLYLSIYISLRSYICSFIHTHTHTHTHTIYIYIYIRKICGVGHLSAFDYHIYFYIYAHVYLYVHAHTHTHTHTNTTSPLGVYLTTIILCAALFVRENATTAKTLRIVAMQCALFRDLLIRLQCVYTLLLQRLLRQHSHFCTSKASTLSTCFSILLRHALDQ